MPPFINSKYISYLLKLSLFTLILYNYTNIFYAAIIYMIMYNIYLQVLKFWLKFEFMSPMDSLYLIEFRSNPNFIISCIFLDRTSFQEIKSLFYENVVYKFKKMRQKIASFMNDYFWVEIPEKEFHELENYLFKDSLNVKNVEDILSF